MSRAGPVRNGPGTLAGGSTARRASRLAWSILACWLALGLAGVGLRLLGPRAGASPFWGEVVAIVVVLGTLGALVAAGRPGHPVGWLFTGIGLAVTGTVTMPERWDDTTTIEEVP